MIYVPDTSYACYVVLNENTIRAYKETPYNPPYNGGNVNIDYRDYYYNSNYLYQDSYETFSYYSKLPVCLDKSTLTDDFYYRNDLDSIFIIFAVLFVFGVFIPLKIFFKFFKRGSV